MTQSGGVSHQCGLKVGRESLWWEECSAGAELPDPETDGTRDLGESDGHTKEAEFLWWVEGWGSNAQGMGDLN